MNYQKTILTFSTLLLLSAAANAQLVTQTMDELPFQPVDGLAFKGVIYGFMLNDAHSEDAKYASYGPISTEYTTDPSIIGDARGILTIDFVFSTPVISVGVAVSDTGPLSPGFTVELFDESLVSLVVVPVDTAPATALGFSDALFQYDGAAVRRMVIDFADEPSSFAVDNLVYQVPEPGILIGLVSLVLAAAAAGRRRR